MKVKEVTVSTGRKMGLPGYSSFDVTAFVTVTLDEKDILEEVYKKAWSIVEDQVTSRIKSKGLESPVAAEAQNPKDPGDWLEHDTPDIQKSKILAAKQLQMKQERLKMPQSDSVVNKIPSIKPRSGGGDYANYK
jgi:hypothetical protein